MKLCKHHIVLVLFAVIIVLGFALRFYSLSYKSLWLDEVYSIRSSEKYSIVELSQKFYRRLPPLYHIILRLFLILGNNEFVARLPSAVFGLLSILLIYRVGALFFGRREGLISAFLLSVSTMHIRYSQDATMYSLAMFLALSSFYFFYRALKEATITMWIGFIISTLLGIFTHYYLVFVPLIEMPLFVFMLFKDRGSLITGIQKVGKNKILVLVVSLVLIAALAFPFLLAACTSILASLQSGIAFQVPWGIEPTPSFFIILFDHFNTGGFLPRVLENWRDPIVYTFLLILFFGLLASRKEYSKPAALLLLWVFLPTTMVFILSLGFGKPIADSKYMILILPGYLISISRAIGCIADSLSKRFSFLSIALPEKNQIMSLMIIMVFAGVSIFPIQEYYMWEKPNWREVAMFLEANSRSDDIIIVEPEYTMECLLYYYDAGSQKTNVMSTYGSFTEIENIESFPIDIGWIQISNTIDISRLLEGQVYEISAWYKGDIPLRASLLLFDAKWNACTLDQASIKMDPTSEWKKAAFVSESMPSGVAHALLCFVGLAEGYFLVDDCSMFARNQARVNILSNGGFEDGIVAWEFEQRGIKKGYFDISTDARTGQSSGQLRVTKYYYNPSQTEESRQNRIFFVYSTGYTSYFDSEQKIRDRLRNNYMEIKTFQAITIYYYQEGLVLVQAKDMQFVGLDSPPSAPEAEFYHNNDSATFEVSISKNTNYKIAIHAKSFEKSAIELSIDGTSQGTKMFVADDWCYVELGMTYLESGWHEIKLISREGGDLGDTNVVFDAVAICAVS